MAAPAAAYPRPAAIDWDLLDVLKFTDEREAARKLDAAVGLDARARAGVGEAAVALVERARSAKRSAGLMESFLQEFGLSNKEGLALMCLAEALLRVPDAKTADALIAEKLGSGAWAEHAWKSDSWLVNASTLGLMLTGSLVDVDPAAKRDPAGYFKRLTGKMGEPVIRGAVRQAMRILGEQFVLGRTMAGAIKRGRAWKSAGGIAPLFSFDMLGEGARTHEDAARYHQRYLGAIAAVAAKRQDGPVEQVDGVSVKLSALHPRYHMVKLADLMDQLYPMVLEQAEAARAADIGFCLDAEESDRLVLQLNILERLAHEPSLAGWNGLGLAVQAYQKRAASVIERLIDLAELSGRRLMVRLVKGAYWDTEIKYAQIAGHPDFPVWSTKPATDLNYLACARLMLGAPGAIYAQFATHNAHTLAAVRALAAEAGGPDYEFQRLHGMGEPLYNAAAASYGDMNRVRVYAPVGSHEDLLPYLVRRLLENGANTSFVHSFLDPDVPAADVARGPFEAAASLDRHPFIPAPPALYGAGRVNAAGTDLTQAGVRAALADAQKHVDARAPWPCGPVISGEALTKDAKLTLSSPADLSFPMVRLREANKNDIARALKAARAAQPGWNALGGAKRAHVLRAMADALEADTNRLIALMARETGKTLSDGVAEVREAVDFLRYYAAEAETKFAGPARLPGPAGETNHLELSGRGVFVCISPWNFPLAIFTGQVAAALAAGNTVLAKPAEQSPLIAFEAVKLYLKAGLPADALHLLPGGADVGIALTGLEHIEGVAFTGSTLVARLINRALAAKDGPIIPLIAETGGLNAMFVDTSALKEQVIDDTILSAFGSAGQRCSAMRLLFVPKETAGGLIEGLKGAMNALTLGDPSDPATDIGPVIDADACAMLEEHVEAITAAGARVLHRAPLSDDLKAKGRYFAPALIEIDSLDQLTEEKFGPILHVLRYKRADLPKLSRQLADKGYGLTLGVHSRLERFVGTVRAAVPAGNLYVNRSMTGAVVGVQPFGGEGLSGTGPKAGGPNYLVRFAAERAVTVNIAAQGGDPELLNL
ncbi:bifunctional proline dehydrogenase/L-glutamate gamma-semialdehyde dehydrogenase PutA [Alkalicaulis satelles]|uniref:Bifunctional protein PutA n=1 Tax=Alkalicaulis satelles TaxID=2609175 RepID=A0A5M6ZJ89_9PROT|nr:bifunctional proline dehydrogenase/L-glutamate gamma-semialdehyde dehydrogenase PutA [Alkalicaulis satelles]KAA5803757.1 bifunctional proline dehydrogenase/L-glutamate gamma-semialdehyde dehydrogenase PutA [Alkalicaulis satelles]